MTATTIHVRVVNEVFQLIGARSDWREYDGFRHAYQRRNWSVLIDVC
jgi:hypothetical protein